MGTARRRVLSGLALRAHPASSHHTTLLTWTIASVPALRWGNRVMMHQGIEGVVSLDDGLSHMLETVFSSKGAQKAGLTAQVRCPAIWLEGGIGEWDLPGGIRTGCRPQL
jgi:hypothetical protein